mmetsp:Transcript_20034/g.49835  ORF Transcript_20034/g.49835 Transcript_20034/m.49835 type:complete len:570 (-) Transcript_20034:535-2244(-)|eukprot:CAMPEP_0181362236 /NCGR_PEP_ID=MMETSP1106-20121128/7858_1 /TAXON_ID=81844 /ORGANISM="Mantoniella antarctica, Strain SL-175" /LENGTH=569 /DNA_ID=CAMNT_0023476095 /DNA_START=184 /DNA_END=1893 /DNA_ORIENTATION=-
MVHGSKAALDDHSSRVGKFMCVVPPKQLCVNTAGQAVRASANGALDEALAALEFRKSSQTVDGGGVAISVGPAIQAFTDNEVIVSFCGQLSNVDYLAWRLFSPEGRRGDRLPQSPLEAASKLTGGRCYEAELVCHMYKTFGTKSLPKLRGRFSFACFDARSVRVFAARDPSGTYPLLYGRDADGTVVVANFDSAAKILQGDGALEQVPAGCFIYGHRGIAPQRYAKDEAASLAEAAAAAGAAANALRGLRVGRKPAEAGETCRASPEAKEAASAGATPDRSSAEWSRENRGHSRLPWRPKSGEGAESPRTSQRVPGTPETPLSARAQPWAAGMSGSAGSPGCGLDRLERLEREPSISLEDGSVLDGLETSAELDTVGNTQHVLEPGTAAEHQQAEAVAVKAVAAALQHIASGVNMKGMVRMGSSNALQALGMAGPASVMLTLSSAATGDNKGSSIEPEEMAIHRVPSRSGLISSMVKVASFANLGKLQKFGSLIDLHHGRRRGDGSGGAGGDSRWNGAANSTGLKEVNHVDILTGDDNKLVKGDEGASWADISLLVISSATGDASREVA